MGMRELKFSYEFANKCYHSTSHKASELGRLAISTIQSKPKFTQREAGRVMSCLISTLLHVQLASFSPFSIQSHASFQRLLTANSAYKGFRLQLQSLDSFSSGLRRNICALRGRFFLLHLLSLNGSSKSDVEKSTIFPIEISERL